jgi:hypothetical protein
MTGRRLPAMIATLALCCAGLFTSAPNSGAILTRTIANGSNAITAGTWRFSLHNNPTPPTANTTAQINLSADGTAPTAGTTFDYSTDCVGSLTKTGRQINAVSVLGATEAAVCNYVNWRTPAFAASQLINGQVTLWIWARKDKSGGTSPTITMYLRDFNPAGAGSYVEIANATSGTLTSLAFGKTVITSTINYTFAAGHKLELKIVQSAGANRDAWLSYDTTTEPSELVLLQNPA